MSYKPTRGKLKGKRFRSQAAYRRALHSQSGSKYSLFAICIVLAILLDLWVHAQGG